MRESMLSNLMIVVIALSGLELGVAGHPCNPCTAEDIRELGIVAPPPDVRPACAAYDDDPTGIYVLVRRPSNCSE